MWNKFSANPDRLVFFGCIYCAIIIVFVNMAQ